MEGCQSRQGIGKSQGVLLPQCVQVLLELMLFRMVDFVNVQGCFHRKSPANKTVCIKKTARSCQWWRTTQDHLGLDR